MDFFNDIKYSSVSGQQHFEQVKNSLTVQLRGQSVETMLLNEVIVPGLEMSKPFRSSCVLVPSLPVDTDRFLVFSHAVLVRKFAD